MGRWTAPPASGTAPAGAAAAALAAVVGRPALSQSAVAVERLASHSPIGIPCTRIPDPVPTFLGINSALKVETFLLTLFLRVKLGSLELKNCH